MRTYEISVCGESHQEKASRASVAVHRVLDKFTDGQLDGATITVRRGSKINYAYRCYASVPCDPPGSFKRDYVSGPMSEHEVRSAVETLRATRQDLKDIWYRRVEV